MAGVGVCESSDAAVVTAGEGVSWRAHDSATRRRGREDMNKAFRAFDAKKSGEHLNERCRSFIRDYDEALASICESEDDYVRGVWIKVQALSAVYVVEVAWSLCNFMYVGRSGDGKFAATVAMDPHTMQELQSYKGKFLLASLATGGEVQVVKEKIVPAVKGMVESGATSEMNQSIIKATKEKK